MLAGKRSTQFTMLLTVVTMYLAALLVLEGCGGNTIVSPGSLNNSVGMTMVGLPTGYYVSKYETRQAEFEAVMGYNPSVHLGANQPVENVTGKEAEEFCLRLTELERERGRLPDGYVYALPTYAQWMDFIADASLDGAITPGPGREFDSPQPVGNGEVNRLGLYDLRGNVAEYSTDTYRTGSKTILGAWWNEHRSGFLRIENRAGFVTDTGKGDHVGFRCVLVREVERGRQ